MDVRTILKRKGTEVATASSDSSVVDIARMLREKRIGTIVLMDGDRLAGIISERDIVRAMADAADMAAARPARDYMTRRMLTCAPDDSTDTLMAMMTEKRVRHLPVLEDGKLAGIVSIGDVVKQRIEEILFEAEQMKQYINS